MIKKCILFCINKYQKKESIRKALINFFLPSREAFSGFQNCRFSPTCSHYTFQAVASHGAFKGVLLGLWRLLRCSPLSKGGVDLVPPNCNK